MGLNDTNVRTRFPIAVGREGIMTWVALLYYTLGKG